MEILGTILIAGFIALILATAFAFGFAIITLCLVMAGIMTVVILVRGAWRRWRFNNASKMPPDVIEVEYRDITRNKEEI